jgi:hypothetical protein
VKKTYHTIRQQGKINERELATFLAKNGQGLLPMVELIEQSRMACDQLIDVTGRAVLQAVLQLSAAQVAGGPQQQGKRRSATGHAAYNLSTLKHITLNLIRMDPVKRKGGIKARRLIAATSDNYRAELFGLA